MKYSSEELETWAEYYEYMAKANPCDGWELKAAAHRIAANVVRPGVLEQALAYYASPDLPSEKDVETFRRALTGEDT